MRDTTIREAKSSLTSLIHAAEKGEPVRLTRHGKPVAVILSNRQFQELTARRQRKDPWEFLKRWRAQMPRNFAGISDEEADSWRDRSSTGGRTFSWGK